MKDFRKAAILDLAVRPLGGRCTSAKQVFENLIPIPITMPNFTNCLFRAELLWIFWDSPPASQVKVTKNSHLNVTDPERFWIECK